MNNIISTTPIPKCEPVKSYGPETTERKEALMEYDKLMNKVTDIPMWIDGKNIKSKRIKKISNSVLKARLLARSVLKGFHDRVSARMGP